MNRDHTPPMRLVSGPAWSSTSVRLRPHEMQLYADRARAHGITTQAELRMALQREAARMARTPQPRPRPKT